MSQHPTGPSTANLGCPANTLQNGYPRETEFKILWLPPSISKHLMDTDGMCLFYPTNIRELNVGIWTHLHQLWLPGKPCAWRSVLRPSPPVTAPKKATNNLMRNLSASLPKQSEASCRFGFFLLCAAAVDPTICLGFC